MASVAIGGALVSIGSFVTAGLATGVIAGMIGGAIVGAAIGGLTAAVTGGDIGKGMLFGGIGGAVLGGLGAYAAPAGTGGITGVTASGAPMGSPGGMGFAGAANQVGSSAGAVNAAGGVAGGMTSSELLKSTALQGALNIGGSILEGADQTKEAENMRVFQEEQQQRQRELQEKLQAMNNETQLKAAEVSTGPAYARIAEDRRQFDKTLEEQRTNRKKASTALSNIRATRGSYKMGGEPLKSFEEMSVETEKKRMGMLNGEEDDLLVADNTAQPPIEEEGEKEVQVA